MEETLRYFIKNQSGKSLVSRELFVAFLTGLLPQHNRHDLGDLVATLESGPRHVFEEQGWEFYTVSDD